MNYKRENPSWCHRDSVTTRRSDTGVTQECGNNTGIVQAVCQQDGVDGHTQWRSLLLHGGQDDVRAVDLVHVPAGLGLVEPLSGQVLPLDVRLCARVEYVFHFAIRQEIR